MSSPGFAAVDHSAVISDIIRPIRIVIADDSAPFLELLSACVAREDCLQLVGTARDGADAIQQVASLRPDLLLMDVHMPHLDGFEAATLIARHLPEVTIVLMSTEDSPGLRARAHASGAHEFIAKARLATDLMTRIEPARLRI
jgi:DNA-binding NarL/FixJ family response regulator